MDQTAPQFRITEQGRIMPRLVRRFSDGVPREWFCPAKRADLAPMFSAQPEGQARQPRLLLLSLPCALKAGDAETLGGRPPPALVLLRTSQAEFRSRFAFVRERFFVVSLSRNVFRIIQ